MSLEQESPVVTILRLLENRIRVISDAGGIASVKCTQEKFDRELLKDYDAQITVGLDPSLGVQDQKLNLQGNLRRRTFYLRCTTFAWNKTAPNKDTGTSMRQKLSNQINAIIRENRTLPYQFQYNFYSLGYPEGYPHKAKDAATTTELTPSSSTWAELNADNYAKIWSNDDILHSKSVSAAGQYPQMLFRFKIGLKAGESTNEPREQSVKNIVLTFVGYGTAAAGDGATLKVWNHTTGAWTNAQAGDGSAKETLTITLAANLTDYIDPDGYIWLLARTTNASNGTPTVLYCDFVQCVTQTEGITNCDVVRYQDVDRTDIQPTVFTSIFIIKAWLIESLPI